METAKIIFLSLLLTPVIVGMWYAFIWLIVQEIKDIKDRRKYEKDNRSIDNHCDSSDSNED